MTRPDPTPTPRPRAADALAVASLAALATAINWVFLLRRPDLAFDVRFLFSEDGISLVLADCILHGGRLYRDVSIPYGPLPTYAHALLALVRGNSMATFVLYCHLLSVAFLVLCYAAMRRRVGVGVALAVAVLGLIPTSLIPAAPMGGGLYNAYTPFERCVFALAFLAWEPITRRTGRQALLLGLILGLAQWVKFGGAFFVGAPIAVLDLAAVLGARADGATRLRLFRSMLTILLGFLIMEGARDLLALAALPRPVALDVIWPGYTLEAYRTMLKDPMFTEPPYPRWLGWKYFVLHQLNVAAAAVAGLIALAPAVVGLARSLRVRDEPGEGGSALARVDAASGPFRLFLPMLFYMAGSLRYFGHAYIYMKYYCFLMIAPAALLARGGAAGRAAWVALVLLWLPPWLFMAKLAIGPIEPGWERFALPDGQSIYLSPDDRDDLDRIFRGLAIDPAAGVAPGDPILVAPLASGFGVIYGLPAPPRNAFMIPEYVRPYDLPAMAERFESARALLIPRWMTDAVLESYLDRTFDPSLRAILARREVGRIRINGRRTILILK